MNTKSILGMVLIALLPLSQANALVLGNWNDADLDASGDFITVDTGTLNGNDWFSMQWKAGANNLIAAQGIDQVYYNFTTADDTLGIVTSVWEGSIGGTDVTNDWSFGVGGTNSGGGFGSLSSKNNKEPAGTNGIDPSILFFVLNGDITFADNGSPNFSTFTAHVRYEENCSGWVSDGTPNSIDSSGNCGTTSIPEPGILALLGIGLVGFSLRKRN